MADDEQFSLCWNNFNTNLSAGFHDSLCRGDLVDVTLAAEGQLVKAHRLVLSVCSPYFRKMFTQMPANQHAFVFLKDVSHSALKDLIQFMYCGEVNVKQDALPAFISTAEALQIKGLTETGEGSSAPPHQSPAKEGPSVPSASPRSKQQTRARVQSYKVESEESSDEKVVQVQTQKRTLQRSITPQVTPVTKRAKITADPLESSDPPTVQTVHVVKQQVQQPLQSSEPEYVEMPMETINPKSEPEYVEDTSEIEAAEQEHDQDTETHELQEQDDTTYVEDESYGDIKYDESYFNENDEAKAGVSGFSESYTEGGDQSASEAQDANKVPPVDPVVPEASTIEHQASPSAIYDKWIHKASLPKLRSNKRQKPKTKPKKIDMNAVKSGPSYELDLIPTKQGAMRLRFAQHHFEFHYTRQENKFYRCVNFCKTNCNAKILVYDKMVYCVDDDHNHTDLALVSDEILAKQHAIKTEFT